MKNEKYVRNLFRTNDNIGSALGIIDPSTYKFEGKCKKYVVFLSYMDDMKFGYRISIRGLRRKIRRYEATKKRLLPKVRFDISNSIDKTVMGIIHQGSLVESRIVSEGSTLDYSKLEELTKIMDDQRKKDNELIQKVRDSLFDKFKDQLSSKLEEGWEKDDLVYLFPSSMIPDEIKMIISNNPNRYDFIQVISFIDQPMVVNKKGVDTYIPNFSMGFRNSGV